MTNLIVFVPLDVGRSAWVSDCELTEEGETGAQHHGLVPGLVLVQVGRGRHVTRGGLDLDGVLDTAEHVPDDAGIVPVVLHPVVLDGESLSTLTDVDPRGPPLISSRSFDLNPILVPESQSSRTAFLEGTPQLQSVSVVPNLVGLHFVPGSLEGWSCSKQGVLLLVTISPAGAGPGLRVSQ